MTARLLKAPVHLLLVAALVVPATFAMAGPASAGGAPERRLLSMVNDERAHQNLRALDMSGRLSRRAERNSREMARSRELSHSGNLRSGMAENVGVATTLRSIVRMWMRSPDHRRNILGNHRLAGVGVDKAAGLFWVTLILR